MSGTNCIAENGRRTTGRTATTAYEAESRSLISIPKIRPSDASMAISTSKPSAGPDSPANVPRVTSGSGIFPSTQVLSCKSRKATVRFFPPSAHEFTTGFVNSNFISLLSQMQKRDIPSSSRTSSCHPTRKMDASKLPSLTRPTLNSRRRPSPARHGIDMSLSLSRVSILLTAARFVFKEDIKRLGVVLWLQAFR